MRRMLGWLACMIPLATVQCSSSRSPEGSAADSGARELPSRSMDASSARIADASERGDAGSRDAGSNRDAGSEGGAGMTPPSAGTGGTGGHAGDASAEPDADSGIEPWGSEDSSCLDAVSSYASTGPFRYATQTVNAVKFWVPSLPAHCKAPVVHFSNGTGATCSNYLSLLERLASHGFLAVCAENPNTGSGVRGFEALDAALSTFPDLAAHKLGSAGHETGGQGALLALQQAETKWGARATYAGLALAPASGFGSQPPGGGTWRDAFAAVKSPLFLISGSADALVSESWVGDAFEALSDAIEAYWLSAVDAPHIPIPLERIQPATVAWFRWKLLGDARACAYFKQLPDGPDWDARGAQNAKACP